MSTYRVTDYIERLRTSVPGRPERPVSVLWWEAAADNFEPTPREEVGGYAVRTDTADGSYPVLVIWREDFGPEGSTRTRSLERDLFLVDDGRAVTPHYVAGWNPSADPGALFLHPFPLDVNPDGTPRMTGDGVRDAMGRPSRPVDMSGWKLGPRRAWHLKVRPARDWTE